MNARRSAAFRRRWGGQRAHARRPPLRPDLRRRGRTLPRRHLRAQARPRPPRASPHLLAVGPARSIVCSPHPRRHLGTSGPEYHDRGVTDELYFLEFGLGRAGSRRRCLETRSDVDLLRGPDIDTGVGSKHSLVRTPPANHRAIVTSAGCRRPSATSARPVSIAASLCSIDLRVPLRG